MTTLTAAKRSLLIKQVSYFAESRNLCIPLEIEWKSTDAHPEWEEYFEDPKFAEEVLESAPDYDPDQPWRIIETRLLKVAKANNYTTKEELKKFVKQKHSLWIACGFIKKYPIYGDVLEALHNSGLDTKEKVDTGRLIAQINEKLDELDFPEMLRYDVQVENNEIDIDELVIHPIISLYYSRLHPDAIYLPLQVNVDSLDFKDLVLKSFNPSAKDGISWDVAYGSKPPCKGFVKSCYRGDSAAFKQLLTYPEEASQLVSADKMALYLARRSVTEDAVLEGCNEDFAGKVSYVDRKYYVPVKVNVDLSKRLSELPKNDYYSGLQLLRNSIYLNYDVLNKKFSLRPEDQDVINQVINQLSLSSRYHIINKYLQEKLPDGFSFSTTVADSQVIVTIEGDSTENARAFSLLPNAPTTKRKLKEFVEDCERAEQ